MKIRKKENKFKKEIFILGTILILLGIIIISIKYLYILEAKVKEQNLLNEFYQEQEIIKENVESKEVEVNIFNKYIAVLKIPKINLEKGLFDIDNPNNNVDKNIQILKESQMPDIENSNLILASHNGSSRVSYFNEIHKLKNGDEVNIIYKGHEYKYEVVNSYTVNKTGEVEIIRNITKTTLTLITCYGNDKQIIFICELKKII